MLAKTSLRDFILSFLMVSAFGWVAFHPPRKIELSSTMDLSSVVPREFEGWRSFQYDTSTYQDDWKAIDRLLLREYRRDQAYLLSGISQEKIGFVLEYNNDLRNNFGFHYPENCHRSSGNQVDFLKPIEIQLGGKTFKARTEYIRGIPGTSEHRDKLVVYWLVMDGVPYYEMFWIKLNQMFSGVLMGSKSGYLVRFDFYEGLTYNPEGIDNGRKVITRFIQDLYYSLDDKERRLLFGI